MTSATRKKTAIVFSIILIVLAGTIWTATRLFDLNRYNAEIVSAIEKTLGGKARLGPITWGLFTGLWLEVDGFTLSNAPGVLGDVDLKRAHIDVSLFPLLARKLVINNIHLEAPEVSLHLPAADQRSQPTTRSSNPSPKFQVLIGEVTVEHGRINLTDKLTVPGRTIVRRTGDVALRANYRADDSEVGFDLSIRDPAANGVGALSTKGTLSGLTAHWTLENPHLTIEATLADLPIESIKPYLRNERLAEHLDGSVSIDVDYTGNLSQSGQVKGVIDLTGLIVTDQSLWDNPLPGVATKVHFSAAVDPQVLNIEKFNLTVGKIMIDARSRLDNWASAPVFKDIVISGNMPLTDLSPLIPWKRVGHRAEFLKEIIAGGGDLKIEKAALAQLDLAKTAEDPGELLSTVKGSIVVSGVTVQPSPSMPKIEDISGRSSLNDGVLTTTDLRGLIGPLETPTMTVRVTDLGDKPKFKATAKGPLHIATTEDKTINDFLQEYGLKSLTGTADVDVAVDYDHAAPDQWTAGGSAVLRGVQAVSFPKEVHLTDFSGRISYQKKESHEWVFDKLAAKVNDAPVGLSGKISGKAAGEMAIALQAETRQLDLAALGELVRPMKDLGLAGKVDLDLDIYLPNDDPAQSRITGRVTAEQLEIRPQKALLAVEGIESDLEFSGRSATIKQLTMRLNDQSLNVTGQLSHPEEPLLDLVITSPDLDIDRLLPAKDSKGEVTGRHQDRPSGNTTEEPIPKEAEAEPEKSHFLQRSSAKIRIEAPKGRFRKQDVTDLRITADYEKGRIKNYMVGFSTGGGQATATGMIDISQSGQVAFTVIPVVETVPVETLSALLGYQSSEIGPASISGRLKATAGKKISVLDTLTGDLKGEMGSGRLKNVGPIGVSVAKMLSLLNVKNILHGKLTNKISGEGIEFDRMEAECTFKDGKMVIGNYDYKSAAFNLNGKGTIDFRNGRVDAETKMEVFNTVGKALSYVPIVGKAAQEISSLHFDINGPLENPKVRLAPVKGIIRGAGETISAPVKILNDALKSGKK